MSDAYSEESFDDYEEDDFEAEEEYDVLPKSMMKSSAASPKPAVAAVTRTQAPARASPAAGNRPVSAQRPLAIPTTPLLSDAELRARRARLARAREKLPHIPLQAVAMEDVFVMVSLSKYDLYSMARGPYAGCKVAAVQTNDDAKEEETQTNEPAQRAYAAQVPDDRNKMSEAEVFAFSMEVGASGGAEARSRVQASSTMGAATSRVMNMSPGMELKLAQFIRWAGPLMLACLGMAPSGKEVTFGPPAAGSQGLGGGLLHLTWPELLDQRPVTALAACPNPLEPLLLVAYGPVGAQLGPAQLLKACAQLPRPASA
ncbi:hypothetical protein V8C86DRAFT_1130830 [Haematococcus lacustris]